MKIRTVADITSAVDGDLAWRKQELTTMKFAVQNARDHTSDALRRAGVALLYAHFEGFVKSAGTSYIEFVAFQGLTHAELKPNFLAMAIRRELTAAKQSSEAESFTKLAAYFVEKLNSPARIEWKNIVQTRSNLGSDVMKNIIATLGFDYSPYATQEKTIIEKLRDSRNNIAHGKFLSIDAVEYQNLHDAVIAMLGRFRDQIDEAVSFQSYRR